jgi:hypothetical protein
MTAAPAHDDPAGDDARASEALAPVEHTEVIAAKDAAVMAAAQMALESPGIPGRDEFLALAMMARVMSMSALVPKALQGKPHDTFLVLLTGRDLGLTTTAALRKVYVVDGQTSLAPQLTAALVRQQGLGRIVPHPENSDRWAAAIPLGPDGKPLGPHLEFTWEDAQIAGLVDATCQPGEHNTREMRRTYRDGGSKTWQGCECKDNWLHYPRRMLWWRAVGYCADDYFPEVSMGLYSPDELGAVIDAEGHPIDPASADLPAGFEPPPTAEEARRAAMSPEDRDAEDRALEKDRAALQGRIRDLPDDVRGELKAKWEGSDRLGRVSVMHLSPRDLRFAESMVRGFESKARAAGWTPSPAETPAANAPPEEATESERRGALPQEERDAEDAAVADTAPVGFPPLFMERWRPPEGPLADKPVTQGGARLANIALGDMGIKGDDRFSALEGLLGRPFTTTKELTEGEARAIAEAAPPKESRAAADHHAAEVLAGATNGGDDVDRIIAEVAAMPMADVSSRLQAFGLPRNGTNDDRRIRLATRLVEESRGAPLLKEP